MARLTNEHLHSEIKLVKNDIEYLKGGQAKMQEDITMIKKTLLDPDSGAIARVNRNTNFRKSAGAALFPLSVNLLWLSLNSDHNTSIFVYNSCDAITFSPLINFI